MAWTTKSLSGYLMHRLYTQMRISSRSVLNSHWSSESCGVDVIELMGMESQWYFHEASKIWQSFLPGFLEDVLWHDESMWQELPQPLGYVNHLVVSFLIVHC